jgi:hypothetical protein
MITRERSRKGRRNRSRKGRRNRSRNRRRKISRNKNRERNLKRIGSRKLRKGSDLSHPLGLNLFYKAYLACFQIFPAYLK